MLGCLACPYPRVGSANCGGENESSCSSCSESCTLTPVVGPPLLLAPPPSVPVVARRVLPVVGHVVHADSHRLPVVLLAGRLLICAAAQRLRAPGRQASSGAWRYPPAEGPARGVSPSLTCVAATRRPRMATAANVVIPSRGISPRRRPYAVLTILALGPHSLIWPACSRSSVPTSRSPASCRRGVAGRGGTWRGTLRFGCQRGITFRQEHNAPLWTDMPAGSLRVTAPVVTTRHATS